VAHKYTVYRRLSAAPTTVYFLAFQELFQLRRTKIRRCLLRSNQVCWTTHMVTEELLNLCRGQGLDIFWRDTLTYPTEDEHIEMVNRNGWAIADLHYKLMILSSNSDIDYVPLVNLIAVVFQIRDDYMNHPSILTTKNTARFDRGIERFPSRFRSSIP